MGAFRYGLTHSFCWRTPSRDGCGRSQLERRSKLDRLVQRPVERAAHCVNAVRPLDGAPALFRRDQAHRHMDAADYKYTFLSFHLSGDFGGQLSVAGIDLARFQRTSKCAHHSTSGRGDDVVDSGSVRLSQGSRIDFVVFRDGPVHTENYRLRFAWQMSNAKRPLTAFDSRL